MKGTVSDSAPPQLVPVSSKAHRMPGQRWTPFPPLSLSAISSSATAGEETDDGR